MKHIKIILVPDSSYPGPAGCSACIYKPDEQPPRCRQPNKNRWNLECLSKRHGGLLEHGGYWTVKASVSRNKREGHYWCKSKGKQLRYPKDARYAYGKAKSISPVIVYNPEHSHG